MNTDENLTPASTREPDTQPTSPPIPVLHVITRLANGGAVENTIYTINGLDRRRWRPALVTGGMPAEDDQSQNLALADDVPLIRVPTLTRNPGLGDGTALRHLRRVIRDGGYKIVHTHGSKAGILGRLAAAKEGVPVIVHGVHGHSFSPQMSKPARVLFRAVERYTARRTTHFVSVGEDLRTQYLAAGVGSPERFSIIHSGMELARFTDAAMLPAEERTAVRSELGIPTDAVVFANVSRMEPRKGHRFFLDAAARLTWRGETPWFVIVGDGPEEEALRAQARELGIAERVIFTGYRGDVERMFAMADVVVLTSLWEGLPRVLVQAAAVGRPAVSFACDGAREIIDDDTNGWVVPMRDVEAVGDRMQRLVDHPEERRRMGEAARAKVNASWTVESMVEQIDTLYRRLLPGA